MKVLCVCVLTLLALCCAPGSGPVKRLNSDLSYKKTGKRQREAGASSSSAAAESSGVTSESSKAVVSKLFLSNKLSAKDAHAVQLASCFVLFFVGSLCLQSNPYVV